MTTINEKAERADLAQWLMRAARCDGLTWEDRIAIGQAIAHIQETDSRRAPAAQGQEAGLEFPRVTPQLASDVLRLMRLASIGGCQAPNDNGEYARLVTDIRAALKPPLDSLISKIERGL